VINGAHILDQFIDILTRKVLEKALVFHQPGWVVWSSDEEVSVLANELDVISWFEPWLFTHFFRGSGICW
jgi:hypothetical protein